MSYSFGQGEISDLEEDETTRCRVYSVQVLGFIGFMGFIGFRVYRVL